MPYYVKIPTSQAKSLMILPGNYKLQITNSKQIPNHKLQITNAVNKETMHPCIHASMQSCPNATTDPLPTDPLTHFTFGQSLHIWQLK
jgi:hypothetical protein